MRLSLAQIEPLKRLAIEEAGMSGRLRLIGSRLDDAARGGDVDLLLQLAEPVEKLAMLAARFAARASRALDSCKVDVVLSAPNLQRQAIHESAMRHGVLL